ncbi:Regulatory protein TenI [compost metagenome]
MYDSGSKPGVLPRGLSQLQEVTAAVNIPVIAIGGIGIDQIDEVLDHGARGIAVIRSILHAEDPEQMAMEMGGKIRQRVLINET